MATAKQTQTTKPAAAPPETKSPELAQTDSTRLARQIYETATGELETNFERFMESSSMEEKRFVNAILIDWGSINFGRPRGPAEYDVPIYSAVQLQIDGRYSVAVPNQRMIGKVEEFIAALVKRSWKAAPYDLRRDTDAEIRDRFARSFRTDAEIFAREAGRPSLRLMQQILVRWAELVHDPEGIKVPNVLAAAAEIELDKLRAETAAEAA